MALDAAETEAPAHDAATAVRSTHAAVCKQMQTAPSVLFLVDQLARLGGGERMLLQLARQLPNYGLRTTVVTFRSNPDPAAFTLYRNIKAMPLSSCFSAEAVRVASRLRRLIRHEQVGIVHTFFETADIYGALVARLAGVRCIVSSRRDMGILRSAKHRAAYRLLAPAYSAVLAVSEQVRRTHLEADRLRPEHVHTIHNGIALERFDDAARTHQVRALLGIAAGVPLVTTVANVLPWKGIDVFLRAAAIVHARFPEATFAVAGDPGNGALMATLRELARSLGIADCVHFLGRVNNIAALLRTSDVFALLSRSEGLPNAVLEAMAASLPIVATAVGGTPEAVRHGATGFLVSSEDALQAAAHIIELLLNPLLRQRLGEAARRRIEQEFSMQQMIRKHVELYDELLRSRE